MGNLYIIKNTVNDKVYIGKTYNTIEQRFKEHKKNARRESQKHNKFQLAIRKYGEDKFYIELIGQFEEGLLEEKEIEYIAKYDSYYNGYNSTLGGDTGKKVVLNENSILEDWENGISMTKIAKKNDVSLSTVSHFLSAKGVYVFDNSADKMQVVMYDRHWNRLCKFENRHDVVQYITDVLKMSSHYPIYQRICDVAESGLIAFKHKWQKTENLIFDEKEFNRVYDKQQYIAGKECIRINGIFFSKEQENGMFLDIDNGKIVKYKKEKIEPKCPDKETLKDMANTKSVQELASIYGVHEATIRRWLRNYGIKTLFNNSKNKNKNTIISLYKDGHSVSEISRVVGLRDGSIRAILRENNVPLRVLYPKTPVEKYKKDGTYLGTYPSFAEAWKSCGDKDFADKIRLCVEGKRKSAGGYIWKKVE